MNYRYMYSPCIVIGGKKIKDLLFVAIIVVTVTLNIICTLVSCYLKLDTTSGALLIWIPKVYMHQCLNLQLSTLSRLSDQIRGTCFILVEDW